jgi:hypothetical protein
MLKKQVKAVNVILVSAMIGLILSSSSISLAGWFKNDQSKDTAQALPGGWVGTDWTGSGKATMFNGFSEGGDMLAYASIVDGALKFDTTSNPSIQGGFITPSKPFGKDFKTLTVIARVKADTTETAGIDFDLNVGGYRQRLQLARGNTIQMYDLTGNAKFKDTNLTEWHTYLITYTKTDKGLLTSIYIDGATAPALTATAGGASDKTNFKLSDGSGSTGYCCYIDWVYYTLDSSVTPENPILPPGISLK